MGEIIGHSWAAVVAQRGRVYVSSRAEHGKYNMRSIFSTSHLNDTSEFRTDTCSEYMEYN